MTENPPDNTGDTGLIPGPGEQQAAFAEEHSDECCFVENQAEGVFVRGH